MGQQIIRQPNGKYSLFSTVVDDFLLLNCTQDDIIEYRVKEESVKNKRGSNIRGSQTLKRGEALLPIHHILERCSEKNKVHAWQEKVRFGTLSR